MVKVFDRESLKEFPLRLNIKKRLSKCWWNEEIVEAGRLRIKHNKNTAESKEEDGIGVTETRESKEITLTRKGREGETDG